MAEKDLSAVLLSSKGGYCIAFFNLVNCDRFQEREVYGGTSTQASLFLRRISIFGNICLGYNRDHSLVLLSYQAECRFEF
jgi:hypothetical protein